MSTVLCISSHVARGHVGAAAARVALERLGHAVWVLPTVVLSNHPGHAVSAGVRVAPETLKAMLDAIEQNGWLDTVDAVLTGYLPSAAHVGVAFDAAGRARAANPRARVLCDPTFGDAPKGLYVEEAAARASADWLLPAADLARLNAFELAWATGRSVTNRSQALDAARALGPKCVIATSVPADGEGLTSLLVEERSALAATVARRAEAPHGTGDFMSGLVLGHLLDGATTGSAFARAVAGVEAAMRASAGADALDLTADADAWAAAAPWPNETLE